MHLRVNWRGAWATQPGHREELQTPAAATERVGLLGTTAGGTGRRDHESNATAAALLPRQKQKGAQAQRQRPPRPDHIRGPGSVGTLWSVSPKRSAEAVV
jgi:hypothetical protein